MPALNQQELAIHCGKTTDSLIIKEHEEMK